MLLPSLLLASDNTLKQGDVFHEPLVGMDFIYVEPGSFMMGSPENEINRYDDEELHKVHIQKGFWIGKFEVTIEQFDQFTKLTKYSLINDNGWGREKRPAINVKWSDANAFAKWMSSKTGHKYRLPTEAEWEYVARAGTTTSFSFGDNEADFPEYAWNGKNANKRTHPVGQKKSNPWGLYDIHGNVWEWTASAYAEEYDGSELKQATFIDKKEKAVVRGGAWYFLPKGMRSADRRLYAPGFRLPYIGFRLVRE